MGEDTTNSKEEVVENKPDDSEQVNKDKDFISKKEWDTLAFKYRQQGKELEKRSAQIDELSEKIKSLSAEPKKDDIAELKSSFQVELEKLESQRDSWKEKFHKVALEGKVKEAAASKVIDVEDFWLYAADRVSLIEDDGKYIPEVKNSVSSLDKFIDDYCAAKPHNARTKKVSGNGVPSSSGTNGKANNLSRRLEELGTMSVAERRRALINDPELLAEVKKGI